MPATSNPPGVRRLKQGFVKRARAVGQECRPAAHRSRLLLAGKGIGGTRVSWRTGRTWSSLGFPWWSVHRPPERAGTFPLPGRVQPITVCMGPENQQWVDGRFPGEGGPGPRLHSSRRPVAGTLRQGRRRRGSEGIPAHSGREIENLSSKVLDKPGAVTER